MGKREDALTAQAKRNLGILQNKRDAVDPRDRVRAKNLDRMIARTMMQVLCEHTPPIMPEVSGYICHDCHITSHRR